MTNWEEKDLSDLGKIVTGKTPPSSEPTFYGGPIPFLTPSDMDGRRTIDGTARTLSSAGASKVKSSFVQHPAVCVSCIGSDMGKAVLVDQPFVSNQQINSVIVNDDTERLFVYYNLAGRKDEIRFKASGAAQPIMNKSDFGRLKLSVPDQPTQRAIAFVLGSLDEKIELNRRMNETLEEMARALFRDWFVDFGPTRRQAEGATDPAAIMGHAFPPEKAATLAPLFPAKLGDNGLPVGWARIPFGNALADTIGGDWGKEIPDEKHDVEVAIVRGTDFAALQEGGKGKVPQRYTTGKKAERRTLIPGDLLLEVSGGSPTQPTGRSLWVSQAMLDRFECDVVPASFCRRFRPKDATWSLVLKQHLNDLYLRGGTWDYQNQSTGISNFQTTHFLEAEQVVEPSKAVLAAFHGVVDPIVQKTATNENQTLAEMRDLLLPKLMSGEIRLKDVEADK